MAGGFLSRDLLMSKWYDIKALADTESSAEIYIYGNIGDKWDEDGVVASSLVKEIAALDVDAIDLRINSFGGSVPDGLAIFNALKSHKAEVTGFIDGVALSCASYIAMAADHLVMAENAQLMIHAPWSMAWGNSKDMREQADILDKYASGMAHGYAGKSGLSYEDALALLTDGVDHWYTAEEAMSAGFVDAIDEAVPVAAALADSFDLSRFSQPAASAAKPQQEQTMPEAQQQAVEAVAPFARTKEMNLEVLAMMKPFEDNPGVKALKDSVLADPSISMEQIQSKLLAEIGKSHEPINPANAAVTVEAGEDQQDKFRAAAVESVMVRAGVSQLADPQAIGANPYRGAKLLDLAKASLDHAGIKTAGMDQMKVVATAFTTSTSDFPVLLENVMHKSLLSAYEVVRDTWSRFCATGSVSDFRAHNRYRIGSFGNLDAVNELGEFTNKSIPDGEKASITASTKGNIINISRQAVINDDLGAFVGLSSQLGRAAARTIESDVYALLALNGGLGPTMADGNTLFHANHGNIGSGAAISMAAIDADRVLMASQMDISGNDYLDLRPAVLLVPIGLGGTARTINDALYDPDTANKLQKPNTVNGLFRDIVDTPRLSGTRRYLFADAMEAPVIEVAFLDGQNMPYLEAQDGFSVDGAMYKVRLDYGIAAVDYRGAVTDAGA